MQKLLPLIDQLQKHSHALPLSYSKIKILLTCGRQYRKRYIEKAESIPAPEEEVKIVGKFLHKLMENLWLKGLNLGMDKDCIDYSAVWLAIQKQYKFSQLTYNLIQSKYITTENIFSRILDTINKYNLLVYPEIQFCADKRGNVKSSVKWPARFFFGYIDFFGITKNFQRAIQIDYKSHSSDSDHTDSLQNDIYTYFLFHRFPALQSIQNGYAFLGDEILQLNTQLHKDSEEFSEIENKTINFLTNYLTKLEKTDFTPEPSKYCSWCEYYNDCSKGGDTIYG